MNETAQLPFGPAPLATGAEHEAGTAGPAGGSAPKAKKRIGAGGLIACMLAAGLLGGGTVAGATTILNASSPAAVAAQSVGFTPVIVNNTDSVNAVTAAAQKASPSVVTISASSGSSGGTGSGIILDTEGHILTNTHVVTLDGAAADAAVEVRTSDGKVYTATIVGTDPLSDLAVIKIDAPGLTPATLGTPAPSTWVTPPSPSARPWDSAAPSRTASSRP